MKLEPKVKHYNLNFAEDIVNYDMKQRYKDCKEKLISMMEMKGNLDIYRGASFLPNYLMRKLYKRLKKESEHKNMIVLMTEHNIDNFEEGEYLIKFIKVKSTTLDKLKYRNIQFY